MTNPFLGMGRGHPGGPMRPDHGYHDLPFPEYADAPVHRRGTALRVKHMTDRFDPRGLRGLDIGCAVGGVTFGLQQAGAIMLGIDADREAIRVARAVEEEQKTGAAFMRLEAPSPEFIALVRGGFDFVVWLSSFMWVAKRAGYMAALDCLAELAPKAPVLWFETAQGPGDGLAGNACPFAGPRDIEAMLRTFYASVEDTGVPAKGWHDRRVFLCRQ